MHTAVNLTDLKTCSNRRDLRWGRIINAKTVETRGDTDKFLSNALISMYGKCGSLVDAHRMFNSIQNRNVVSWNALLLGYAENGEEYLSFDLFFRMTNAGCVPTWVTYLAVVKACTFLAVKGNKNVKGDCLDFGKWMHSEIGMQPSHNLLNALIDMYAKCGDIAEARELFDSMQKWDVVSWNALISGYVLNGEGGDALDLFSKMKTVGFAPDNVTYIAALKACVSLAKKGDDSGKEEALKRLKEIHSEIGGHLDYLLQGTLVDMYGKCGSMADAHKVFNAMQKPDVLSWNVLLLGYIENGEEQLAMDLFTEMKKSGCVPNSFTYVAALKACTSLAINEDNVYGLKLGRTVHSEIGSRDLDLHVESTLVDMYAKCGSMLDARQVFDNIKNPNAVSWTALLLGYTENGEGHVVLDLFSRMKASNCAPDSVTYVAVIKACGLTGAIALGRKLHRELPEFSPDVVTCLIDFYSKCGNMLEAREVFDLHPSGRNAATWTVLLTGYARFGDTESLFDHFEAMQDDGLQPDAITFLCILLCCSHAGLVEKAKAYFKTMVQSKVTPNVMHYNCMVDVLGRANQMSEAVCAISKMPSRPNSVTWLTLLSACRKWKNLEIGRTAFDSLADMDKMNLSGHLLMAHIYGSKGMWEEQDNLLKCRARVQVNTII